MRTYAIYFHEEFSAGRAGDELTDAGYAVEFQPQPGGGGVVLAVSPSEQTRLSHDEILAVMERIAHDHYGDLIGSGGLSSYGLGQARRDA